MNAQCRTGNCINGTGTYDYGWCVYTGEFKNSKPEGKGTMKYDDYSYTGNFSNGLEDGEGVITNKDGTKENVHYTAGKKYVSQLVKIPEAEYKPLDPQDKNCLSGNCITGYGTYQFPSGNKYTGNFKDRKFEGQGLFVFANGDKFEGLLHNNEKVSGTYYYSSVGATYKGTYDAKGSEYNGTVTASTGFTIPYVNGKAIIPVAPQAPTANTNNNASEHGNAKPTGYKTFCPICNGTGKFGQADYTPRRDGNNTVYSYERPRCIMCNGTGYVTKY